jgi:hypothetical protein
VNCSAANTLDSGPNAPIPKAIKKQRANVDFQNDAIMFEVS